MALIVLIEINFFEIIVQVTHLRKITVPSSGSGNADITVLREKPCQGYTSIFWAIRQWDMISTYKTHSLELTLSKHFILIKVVVESELIVGTLGMRQEFILDGMPVHFRALGNTHSCSNSHLGAIYRSQSMFWNVFGKCNDTGEPNRNPHGHRIHEKYHSHGTLELEDRSKQIMLLLHIYIFF